MFLVYTVMVSWVYTYLSTHRVVDIKYVQLLYIQKKNVVSKEASLKVVAHTFVSFHMLGLLGPTSTISRQSRTQVTLKMGSWLHPDEQSKHLAISPRHWLRPAMERQVSVLSQAAAVAAHAQWSEGPAGLQT